MTGTSAVLKVWIHIYPDRPLTKSPQRHRMGRARARRWGWPRHPVSGHFDAVPLGELAREALRRHAQTSMNGIFVTREGLRCDGQGLDRPSIAERKREELDSRPPTPRSSCSPSVPGRATGRLESPSLNKKGKESRKLWEAGSALPPQEIAHLHVDAGARARHRSLGGEADEDLE